MSAKVEYTVFTKPWKMPTAELAKLVKEMGFAGIELPVRPGYQVEPENITEKLPEAARIFADHGLRIATIAGPTDEKTIAACGEAGVPMIRVMARLKPEESYQSMEDRTRKLYESLIPALDEHGVRLGMQNHCDEFVCDRAGTARLLEGFDTKHIAAVLDFCHCALAGEIPNIACDIIWDKLCLINMKNCYRKRVSAPDAKVTEWQKVWCLAREGFSHYPTIAEELHKRNYVGDICLSAEYSDEEKVNEYIADDLAFAKELFGG